jgi:hypothetical protein
MITASNAIHLKDKPTKLAKSALPQELPYNPFQQK